MSDPIHVVVVGCGYAGMNTLSNLNPYVEKGVVKVTMIEKREFWAHKISGVRSTVLGGHWVDRVLIPINKVCPKATIVQGFVTSINDKDKIVEVKVSSSSQTAIANASAQGSDAARAQGSTTMVQIPYDILVCATGSRNRAPADLPPHVTTFDQARSFYGSIRDAIHRARNIMIIGGGPVSLEIAGEIRDAYDFDKRGKNEEFKEITIVCAASEMFSSNVLPLSQKFFNRLSNLLNELEIKVQLNARVVEPPMRSFINPIIQGEQVVTFADGSKRECDLLILAAGWELDWCNPSNEVITRPTLHVADRYDVFALGDITSLLQTKLGYNTNVQAPTLVRNLIKVAKEMANLKKSGALTTNIDTLNASLSKLKFENAPIDKSPTLALTLGPRYGLSVFYGSVYGSWITRMAKGDDLFSPDYFKIGKSPVPKAKIRVIDFDYPPSGALIPVPAIKDLPAPSEEDSKVNSEQSQ